MKITESKLRSIIRSVIKETYTYSSDFNKPHAVAARDRRHADADAKTSKLNAPPMNTDNFYDPTFEEIMEMPAEAINRLSDNMKRRYIAILEDEIDLIQNKLDNIY
jgi:hypothetical protein